MSLNHTAAFEPKVIRTFPRNLATDISLKAIIKIDFSTDLDRDHIEPYVQVFTEDGQRLSGKAEYNERTISFTPTQSFSSHKTIRVVIVGDDLSGKNKGIRSVLGERMRGNHTISFTTVRVPQLPAPVIKGPIDQSIISTHPSFDWEVVEGARHYQIEVSTSNMMNPVFWPAREDAHVIFESGLPVSPDVEFSDSNYYWRVRAVASDGTVGEWSTISQFYLDTQKKGTVSADDVVEIPFVDTTEYEQGFEVLSVFPENKFSNVATNLKTIYIHLLGEYELDQVKDAFTIIGERTDGDETDPELIHGEIKGTVVNVLPQEDGTTIITLELPDPDAPLPEPDEELDEPDDELDEPLQDEEEFEEEVE